jgi:hypothetical protein
MLKEAGHKCSVCNWKKINPFSQSCPLNIDHIDGDSTNNNKENLQVLCPNCHSLTSTWGSLNKGNGRAERRKKRQMQA